MTFDMVELHDTLFFSGKNFKNQIYADAETALELVVRKLADSKREFEFLQLTYRGKKTLIPLSNVKHFTEQGQAMPLVKQTHHAMDTTKIKAAQVSTPHDAVFAGPGGGKTRM